MSPLRPPHVNGLTGALVGGVLNPSGAAFIWGAGGPLMGPQQTLVSIQVGPAEAGPWTITLAAVAAGNGSAIVPPGLPTSRDAQVWSNTLRRALTLTWGNGGASDTCLLDYPYGGATFTVHGGRVLLQTVATQTGILPADFIAPQVAAWCSPGARGGQAVPVLTCTTTIPASVDLAQYIEVPKHATAYMVRAASLTAAGFAQDMRTCTVDIWQMQGGSGGRVAIDRGRNGTVWGQFGTNDGPWTPLLPDTTCLQVGIDAVGQGADRPLAFVFAMDLG